MRIFVAGASGAIGRRLVPMLVEAGHDVTGMVRSERSAGAVRALDADVAFADALDRQAVLRAVRDAGPDVVVHELTSLGTGEIDPLHFDRTFEATNRLRTLGTDHLLEGARAAGARRFIAQSYAGWPFAREGGPVKDEDAPLATDLPKAVRPSVDAILHVERAVTGATDLEGLVLRYGGFYGPGTSLALGEPQVEMVRKRRFPIVGDGGGVWSFLHIEDAAGATVAAIERGAPGIYHVVDDEPAPVSVWLPELARVLGAPPPRRIPAWVARPIIGEHGVVMMTEIRGASNAKAKRELGWTPRVGSWRQGFRDTFGVPRAVAA
jgi:nucleoside-diphosphate-sugar epimerase